MPQQFRPWLRLSLPAILVCLVLGGAVWYRRSQTLPVLPDGIAYPTSCPPAPKLHSPLLIDAPLLNGDRPLNPLLTPNSQAKISILVEKSRHRLTLYREVNGQRIPVKAYPVVFGGPRGDKRQEGDRRTPEGIFRLQDKYPHPNWSKFLWLDYPTADSECKHLLAKGKGEISPVSTVGSEIGIHGVPEGADAWIAQRRNWTLGCPSLTRADIDEIYQVVTKGTMVEIVP
jgi:lipoprotein-anchoring transpeptidase ErfK/SrfK